MLRLGVYGMPVYRVPAPVLRVMRIGADASVVAQPLSCAAPANGTDSLQPWSCTTGTGAASGAVDVDAACRLTVTATTSATARMSAPTATPSWRTSGAFETVRGAVADIGILPGAGSAP